MKDTYILVIALSLFGLIYTPVSAQNEIVLHVDQYSPENPGTESSNGDLKWDMITLTSDRLTQYTFATDKAGKRVIKAVAENAASGLAYDIRIDPNEYQVIEWRWKIDSVLAKGDLEKKSGDDYPVRIYITFDYDKRNLGFIDRIKYAFVKTFTSYRIPLRSLNYIWANKAARGTFASNPFTGWVQMVAVESGNEKAGMWITESRNIYHDYKQAFGEEPPMIDGVAIMTDSDNTGGTATGYYGDIIFRKTR